jgi:hypothetical protein
MAWKLVLRLVLALSNLLLSFSVAHAQYRVGIQGSVLVHEVTSTCA